jgi:hypothetical protein
MTKIIQEQILVANQLSIQINHIGNQCTTSSDCAILSKPTPICDKNYLCTHGTLMSVIANAIGRS